MLSGIPHSPSTGGVPVSRDLAKPRLLCRHRAAFTLIELLAVIAITAVLVGFGMIALGRARLSAKKSESLTNLRSIGQATHLYLADNRNILPPVSGAGYAAPYWCQLLTPYLTPGISVTTSSGNTNQRSPIFVDPLVDESKHNYLSDYGANRDAFRMEPDKLRITEIRSPAQLAMVMTARPSGAETEDPAGVWIVETYSYLYNPTQYQRPSFRKIGQVLCVFADGHTQAIPRDVFEETPRKFLLANP